jgi:DNA-binding PadR family transcriptional regulator
MNIRFAILGLLRAKSMSGYDIKSDAGFPLSLVVR